MNSTTDRGVHEAHPAERDADMVNLSGIVHEEDEVARLHISHIFEMADEETHSCLLVCITR